MRFSGLLLVTLAFPAVLSAQPPNWPAVDAEALKTLQSYIRINTSPAGDVTKAADLLIGILEREGIPVRRFESGPGRSIVMARLKGTGPAKPILLLHHMDVVPADASRWKRDPFGGEIAEGRIWGRGAMDMKGPGVAHLYAFIMVKRQNVAPDRDIILALTADEELSDSPHNGVRWLLANHRGLIDAAFIIALAVGLLFAGSDTGGSGGGGLTYVNPITAVLGSLDAELVLSPNEVP